MKCYVCRKRITDEEMGISEVLQYDMCVECLDRFRKLHSLMRKGK
jgi:hypothetical protein